MTEDGDATREAVDAAIRGLRDAIERLREWMGSRDRQSPTSLTEALRHVKALENARVNSEGSTYYELRDGHPSGPVVAGLVFARNLADHEPVLVEERRKILPFMLGVSTLGGPDTLGGGSVSLTWKPLADLPAPSRPETHGRDRHYEEACARRPVIDTLEQALVFFAGMD